MTFAKVNEIYKYEIHCFRKDTYEAWGGVLNGGFPENSYFFDEADKAAECLSDLIKNKDSGIFFTEFIQNDFAMSHSEPLAQALG